MVSNRQSEAVPLVVALAAHVFGKVPYSYLKSLPSTLRYRSDAAPTTLDLLFYHPSILPAVLNLELVLHSFIYPFIVDMTLLGYC